MLEFTPITAIGLNTVRHAPASTEEFGTPLEPVLSPCEPTEQFVSRKSKSEIKSDALAENTAQSVFKHLRELEANRAHVLSRWIWELMQNARDASSEDGHLVVSVEHRAGGIAFLHNGRGFREEEIVHLIYHGSTKADDATSLGQFGSGFLSTHLLSSSVAISGRLLDGRWFDFDLVRKGESPANLQRSLDAAWESFDPSDHPLVNPLPADFSTRFQYRINTDEANDAVTKGITTLRNCAPLVMAFNAQFRRIRVDDHQDVTDFAVTDRRPLPDSPVTKVSVSESRDGDRRESSYLLSDRDSVSVAVQIQTDEHQNHRCVDQHGPRLYLGFPLIGTERFSLPVATNSFKFGPTEPRDGIYLGQAEGRTNEVNQRLVQIALGLHVDLIAFAASAGYRNAAALAVVPPILEQSWLNVDWLRVAIRDKLIEPIRTTRSIVADQRVPLTPSSAVIPCAQGAEEVAALQCMLAGVDSLRPRLPSRSEAESWCNAIRSWEGANEDLATLEEAWTGGKLADFVHSEAKEQDREYGTLARLRALLVDKDGAVEWIDALCGFLMRTGLAEALNKQNLVLDQAGYLDSLPNLYRDTGVDEELKQIADDLLGLGLREELRDVRIKSLRHERGKGDLVNRDVVQRLLDALRKQTQQPEASDAENPREASVRLFAWMLRNGHIGDVEHFPVWSQAKEGDNAAVIWLERTGTEDAERPLAPIKAWPSGLQEFADLFPRNRVMAPSYFSHLPESDHWNALSEDGLLRTDVVLRGLESKNFQDSLPDEPLPELSEGSDHVSTGPVEVVNVAYFVKDRVGIMSRVPDAPKRGILFWRFLTEYVIPKEAESLEAVEADCECGESHGYFRAAWLEPLAKRKWVPLGVKQRDYANARSLAALLSDSPQLGTSKGALKLLSALGMTQLELTLEFLAGEGKEKADLDANLAKILEFTGGDLASVSQFVEDLAEDHGLMEHLDDRRKSRQRVQRNQKIGLAVERAVRECLEEAGFVVRRTGIGSDFEIEFDPLDDSEAEALGIEVIGHDRQWLIEVKATRGSEVRMTRTQARTAVEKGEQFLLCVVPLDVETVEIDQLPTDVRFVEGIGQHLHSLCDDLDELVAMREAATEEEATDGVRLEILGGKERICVSEILWCDAVSLPDLAAMLARTD